MGDKKYFKSPLPQNDSLDVYLIQAFSATTYNKDLIPADQILVDLKKQFTTPYLLLRPGNYLLRIVAPNNKELIVKPIDIN